MHIPNLFPNFAVPTKTKCILPVESRSSARKYFGHFLCPYIHSIGCHILTIFALREEIFVLVWRRDMTAVFLSDNAKLKQSMNEFDKQMNALRIQFRNERVSIQKDCNRTIGHLNTAIGQVKTPEAREALRAEKQRVYEATRQSMKYNRLCYHQQLNSLQDQCFKHFERHPSKTRIKSILAYLCKSCEAEGQNSLSITFGENKNAKITFE